MFNNDNYLIIFLGSDYVRTVDTKFIQAMAKLWLKLTERYVII